MCKFLFALYGRDTRATQVLNLLLSMWWFVTISLTGLGVTQVELPYPVAINWEDFTAVFMVAMVTSVLSFTVVGRPRQILKVFAFLLGALTQAVLANAYLTEYPPLDMMMCVSTLLALYFSAAVLYIFKCEGLDGMGVQH